MDLEQAVLPNQDHNTNFKIFCLHYAPHSTAYHNQTSIYVYIHPVSCYVVIKM